MYPNQPQQPNQPPQGQQPPQYGPQPPATPQQFGGGQPANQPIGHEENPFVIHKPIDTYGDPTYDGMRPPQAYPVDYLNQIAAKPPAKPLSPKIVLAAIAAGLLVMGVFASFLMFGDTEPDISTRAARLNARYLTLHGASQAHFQQLKSGELRAADTGFRSFLKTASQELTSAVSKRYNIKDLEKSLSKTDEAAEEAYAAKLNEKLSDAALNGTIDRIYTREMIYELDLLKPQIQSIKEDTKDKDIEAALTKAADSLLVIEKTYDDYAADATE